ncbi:hypothetical protein [Thioflexithrix psekupsensis]|uniref:Uncharacterized protein n=1 Tax=Thioflexithrix psekupsensis TaxID=1570016 RepID=A0A251XAG1_9GAMM|nr:hypothetical protein [Thioflexithrix psekupsensis]OUD14961.1 hypothetical protein TPSD3_04445 [Thioflexithrix psekupsensis]
MIMTLLPMFSLMLSGLCVSLSLPAHALMVNNEQTPIPLSEVIAESEETLHFNGKITYVDVEGGFYGITADDGRRFMPTNLPDKFKQAELAVAVQAVIAEDVIGIHMWGQSIELLQIDVLSVVY